MKSALYALVAFVLGVASVIAYSCLIPASERVAVQTYDVWSFLVPVGEDPPDPEARDAAMWIRAAAIAQRKAAARLNDGIPEREHLDLILTPRVQAIEATVVDPSSGRKRQSEIAAVVAEELGAAGKHELEAGRNQKPQPGATDNPDDAQRLREDH